MSELLSIGDFARATHLSVKALRHYHEQRLLEPVRIDAASGYRRYGLEQIPTAQIIRRFRALGMPLEDIRDVLRTSDLTARNELIARHLRRLERELASTQSAVASLRDLPEHPQIATPIEHRRLPAWRAAAVTGEVETADIGAWYSGALGELYPVNRHHTAGRSRWRTEIGWPIFATGVPGHDRGRA
ncbi:MAG TPA: helix-turn-helix domain-containing protein [Gryllotalpicola sp.]